MEEPCVDDVSVCIKVDNSDALAPVEKLWISVALELAMEDPAVLEILDSDGIEAIVALLPVLIVAADWLDCVDPDCVDNIFVLL
jgi:hypothetical protein